MKTKTEAKLINITTAKELLSEFEKMDLYNIDYIEATQGSMKKWVEHNEDVVNETLFIYLYRDEEEILSSYKKAKKLGYYLGWEEFYEKYKNLFPNIDSSINIPKFNHLVWESQISSFDHALTLSYSSFTGHPDFIKDRSVIKKLKQIGKEEKNLEIKLNNKINFSFFEKIYFLIRRKIESRKKDMKYY